MSIQEEHVVMKNGRINGREVARLAGVSPATVSLVVNGSPLVKDETRKRVQEVIDRLGYQSHAAAAALRSSRAYALGYLIPEIFDATNDVFRHQVLAAVANRAKAANYHVLLDTFLQASDHISLFNSGRIDGALIDFSIDDATLAELLQRRVPFVLVGRDAGNVAISSVKADEYGGVYAMTRHLLALGHRRIALLSAGENDGGRLVAQERIRGFQRALAEASITIDPAYVAQGDWRYASGFVHGKRLLSLQPRPTAIFALAEIMAVGVLNAAHEMGLRVPDDLSIVTTEDSPWVEYVRPQLTAVHVPMFEVGARATDLLLAQLDQPEAPLQQITLPTTLVIRESSALPGVLD